MSDTKPKCGLTPTEVWLTAIWRTVTSDTWVDFILDRINSNLDKRVSKALGDPKPQWLSRRLLSQTPTNTPGIGQTKSQSMPPEWTGHKIAERVIVYHEADRAGPHVESYLLVDGKGYNLGVKRLRPEHLKNIKKNSKGYLTQSSKDYLINVLRTEFNNRAWLAQTTDHSPNEARMSWVEREYDSGYGAGEMRQVLSDERVDLFKTGQAIEWRDWTLNPHANAYVYGIMQPNERRSNRMLSLGFKETDYIAQDRLHLKPHIGTQNFDRFKQAVGPDGIITIKEDGASFYFECGPKGTNYWSPRISKKTGRRISYNANVRDLVHVKCPTSTSGMGELNYVDNNTGRVLTAHETGGILNRQAPIPDSVSPRLTIYRIDKVGRKEVFNERYSDNILRCSSFVSGVHHPGIKVPIRVSLQEAERAAKHAEGLVGIPVNKPISEGHKYKPRGDTYDWTVDRVDLRPGPSGRDSAIAGVVWFKNDNGDSFKIGPGSMGTFEVVNDIMLHPNNYVGRTAKVHGYQGHEGRAARFVEWHTDKGEA